MRLLQAIYTAAFALLVVVGSAQAQELRFNANHKFKIVQFTDIHWKFGNPKSDIAAERMAEVLDADAFEAFKETGDIFNCSFCSFAL